MTTTLMGTKVYDREDIRALLVTQKAIERAIVRIFELQTQSEQASKDTHFTNGVGFNKPDARRMSKYARWIMSGRHLTDWFFEDAKDRIQKYVGQLTRIANKEI